MRLCIWVCCVPSVGEQLPLFGGAVDLRRRNTALLSGGSVVAPHRRANACFLYIYIEVLFDSLRSVYK